MPRTSGQQTVAGYCAQLAGSYSDAIIAAVRDEGPDRLLEVIHQALSFRPPPGSGIDPTVALVTVLAAQIPPWVSLDQRLRWTRGFDPALKAHTGRPDLLTSIEEAA